MARTLRAPRPESLAKLRERQLIESSKRYWVGKRVELHPATDAWMMGDRYGDVVDIMRNGNFKIRMDKSNKIRTVPPALFMGID
tara:strand:+ start:3258 stop:3509 length:252 start_codon:yes stop_codon:yes gene_type:complete